MPRACTELEILESSAQEKIKNKQTKKHNKTGILEQLNASWVRAEKEAGPDCQSHVLAPAPPQTLSRGGP